VEHAEEAVKCIDEGFSSGLGRYRSLKMCGIDFKERHFYRHYDIIPLKQPYQGKS
jgi:hypothetical protein